MTDIAFAPPSAPVRDLIRRGLLHLAVALTNVGVGVLMRSMAQTAGAPNRIGWGTGTTAADVTQTTLVAEAAPTAGGGRTAGVVSTQTTSQPDDTLQVQGAVFSTSLTAVTEAGLFDAASGGNMVLRANFSTIYVDATDSIVFTFKVKLPPAAA